MRWVDVQGIALTTEQFQIFLDALPEVLSTLEGKGIQVRKPSFAGGGGGKKVKEEESEEEEEEAEESDGDDDDD